MEHHVEFAAGRKSVKSRTLSRRTPRPPTVLGARCAHRRPHVLSAKVFVHMQAFGEVREALAPRVGVDDAVRQARPSRSIVIVKEAVNAAVGHQFIMR